MLDFLTLNVSCEKQQKAVTGVSYAINDGGIPFHYWDTWMEQSYH